MPFAATASHLAANLAALGERNADLVAKLADRPPSADMQFVDTPDGVPAGIFRGRHLCSRHRPLDEADRLIADLDLVANATVVVHGFGMGYHVQRLADRFRKAGLIIVFEPDLDLLRAVFDHVDHSPWMKDALLLFITDPTDRGLLARKVQGAESIMAQGVVFLEDAASRTRIGPQARQFGSLFSDFMATAKLTLMTTLMRSVDTVRNLLLNIDHYAAGPGVAELENLAAGYPAVVVSAGPSLAKNIHLLREEKVRERCVIIAVQTTLKPLLNAGIRPHFVTALDYHEISRRFYEDLPAGGLQDVTLVADPKAHPVILDVFPGPVRCCAIPFLDKVLGDRTPNLGALPAGATVAHLAVYVARHLGCDPIALVGQDLGFTDGLYYAPGTAIHRVWGPELNPFNTIAMMEWQRIVRHRVHLEKTRDVHGRSIYTDAQMVNYLHQFERDFGQYEEAGISVIDATEGGVVKQHTTAMPLAQVLERHARRPLPSIPAPDKALDPQRLKAACERVSGVRRDVAAIGRISGNTAALIRKMFRDQEDDARMARHFKKIEQYRHEVEQRFDAFELLNHLNQLGVFKRMKADRRLHMQEEMGPLEYQRGQLERDLENVIWIEDAAEEMVDQLLRAERLLNGEPVSARPRPTTVPAADREEKRDAPAARVCALIPVDPKRNGLGVERSLAADFQGVNVLQATLQRLGRLQSVKSIILFCPDDFDVEGLLERSSIGLPVEIERCAGSPFGDEQEAIAAARMWADTCWRGGVGGMSVYDEVLCPRIMHRIMEERGITAALLAAPDWPLIDITAETGCDAVVNRHLEHPEQLNLVFTQSPPGLCGCVISASLMSELAQRNRLSTVGGLLVYQPHAPQGDPIARDANVQIDHRTRSSMVRVTYDSSRNRQLIDDALAECGDPDNLKSAGIVDMIENQLHRETAELPQQLIVELTARRLSRGLFARHHFGEIKRAEMTRNLAEHLFEQFADVDYWVVSFAGVGDPLLGELFDDYVNMARNAGAKTIHFRTELLADRDVLNRLMSCGIDVLSIDLHADRAATYEVMMGHDRFKEVLHNIEYILNRRNELGGKREAGAFALPWIVPRLQRRDETYEDIESFFDRWQQVLGTAVIEAPPQFSDVEDNSADDLIPAFDPPQVMWEKLRRRMTVYCDGSVPVSEMDLTGAETVGNIADTPLRELWRAVLDRREEIRRSCGENAEELRTWQP
ncbi:MAG: DUF115 domain-containing protein [Phycisphaerales bacterium]|nr:MAG: DUF115 domain-containing protein [Phycisphaerales bacterium]